MPKEPENETREEGEFLFPNARFALHALLACIALNQKEIREGKLSPEDRAERQRIQDEVRKRAEKLER